MADTNTHQNIARSLADCKSMLNTLQSWAQAGWIRWLDAELAEFLYQEAHKAATEPSPMLLLGAALCSHQNGHGHLCLDLIHCLQAPDKTLLLPPENALHTPEITPGALLSHITLTAWLDAFAHPLLCARETRTDKGSTVQTGSIPTPLVLYHNQRGAQHSDRQRPQDTQQHSGKHQARLYLRRYWQYEHTLKTGIQSKLQTPIAVDENKLKQTLSLLFDNKKHITPDWQKIACALSLRSQFAIITGGPGTGKTTTVVKLLSVLQSLQQHDNKVPRLRIRLAAPTGKAAARLSASIAAQASGLPDSADIPRDVSTLHRLLGPLRHSRFFKYNAANPLPADVVVVDEASMVDIELMAHLMDALPAQCRLILLGDKDQLASVEAGAVLGSLCANADDGNYRSDTADWIARVCAETIPDTKINRYGRQLDQAITMLRYSHRFGAVPGIGELAKAVNAGEVPTDLFNGQYTELRWIKVKSSRDTTFENLICDEDHGYGYYLTRVQQAPATDASAADRDLWAEQILSAHAGFQLLAAVRKGEMGVEELNIRIRALLVRRGLIDDTSATTTGSADWYAGRPVMVTRNDYNLQLMNGDTGITLPYPDPGGKGGSALRVAFRDTLNPGQIRWILPTRLQEVETVFAMTVHKSQGSEFTHTALVLPTHDSPILTRELIYTGITRASKQFTLIAGDSRVLQQAVQTRVFRAGGLEDALS